MIKQSLTGSGFLESKIPTTFEKKLASNGFNGESMSKKENNFCLRLCKSK